MSKSWVRIPPRPQSYCIMGRYISTGIVCQYCFSKKELERQYAKRYWEKKSFPELKQILIDQLPEIYDYSEDENYLYFELSKLFCGDDLIATMKSYYSLVGMADSESDEIEMVCERLKGKTLLEAYGIARERQSYLLYDTELGNGNAYYAYPLVIDGEKQFFSVHASIITIESSAAKTITEDDLISYDFFTDLLRYRMKPDKLADAMLIFLSP